MMTSRAAEIAADKLLIEAGLHSSLVTLGQMLAGGPLVLTSQDFIHSPAAAHTLLQRLRSKGVEIAVSLSGRISGTFILVLDHKAAQQLVTVLVGAGAATPVFDEMARSALKETGNVVASAFLGALEALSGRGGMPGLPTLQTDTPCHDASSVGAQTRPIYALPLVLDVGTDEEVHTRGGMFIRLHRENTDLPFPAR